MEKKKQKDLLIIIPAYNEEGNIEKLLKQLEQPEIAEIADVLVMNDASSDDTNWIVKKRGHALVTHVFNLGYGSGLQLGYKYAIRRNYKYLIQMDADGQHDVCNIKVLYDKLRTENANGRRPDIVVGSRFMPGSAPYRVSAIKAFAMRLFRFMIRVSARKRMTDPTSGLQGLNRRAVLYYSKYNHFDDRYPDANMIMQMLLLGFEIEEAPVVMHQRTEGVSMHSGIKPFFYMFRMMISIIAIWIRVKILKIDVNIDRYLDREIDRLSDNHQQ